MPITLTLPTVDKSASASKLVFPVEGAKYLNVFGANDFTPTRNLSLTAQTPPVVVGEPVAGDGYTAFLDEQNYIDSKQAVTGDFTIIALVAPANDASHCAVIGSEYINIWFNNANAGDSTTALVFAYADNPRVILNYSDIFSDKYMPFLASYNSADNTLTFKALASGEVKTKTSNGTQNSTESIKIGLTNESGLVAETACHNYFTAVYDRLLTDTEVASIKDWLDNYYAVRFGLAV